jgi:hypothetical protein
MARQVRVAQIIVDGAYTCGYPDALGPPSHIATVNGSMTAVAEVDSTTFGNAAACGRCFRLLRTMSNGVPQRMVDVTVVGRCSATELCSAAASDPQFRVNASAFNMLASSGEGSIPSAAVGDMVTAYDIPCPFGPTEIIYGAVTVNGAGNTLNAASFVGHLYGLTGVRVQGLDLQRSSTNRWSPPIGMTIGSPPWRFDITDINGRTVTTSPLDPTTTANQPTDVQNPSCP